MKFWYLANNSNKDWCVGVCGCVSGSVCVSGCVCVCEREREREREREKQKKTLLNYDYIYSMVIRLFRGYISLSISFGGAWVAQWVKPLTSGQVMISQSVSSSPVSGSVLTAQNLEPASDSGSPSLSVPPPSLSVKNKRYKKRTHLGNLCFSKTLYIWYTFFKCIGINVFIRSICCLFYLCCTYNDVFFLILNFLTFIIERHIGISYVLLSIILNGT